MKATLAIFGCLMLAAHAVEQAARTSGIGLSKIPADAGVPNTDRITDEELLARRAAALHNQPAPKPLPAPPASFGLLEMSTVLQNDGEFLLVPKGSVLWCPPALKERIVAKPSGKMSGWTTFVSANRGWITHYEVTREQVTGKAPIPPAALEQFQKSNSLVIATLNGGPVTVLSSRP